MEAVGFQPTHDHHDHHGTRCLYRWKHNAEKMDGEGLGSGRIREGSEEGLSGGRSSEPDAQNELCWAGCRQK